MGWTDDPIADFDRWQAEQEEELEKLPICECCGQPIQQEYAVYYNNQWCCEDCESDFWNDIRDDFTVRVDEDD